MKVKIITWFLYLWILCINELDFDLIIFQIYLRLKCTSWSCQLGLWERLLGSCFRSMGWVGLIKRLCIVLRVIVGNMSWVQRSRISSRYQGFRIGFILWIGLKILGSIFLKPKKTDYPWQLQLNWTKTSKSS